MKRTFPLYQFCYTAVPRGLKSTSGWETFARTPGFDQVSVVEAHCRNYSRPRGAGWGEGDPLPVDYGFRRMDQHACIYRICDAGTDEFGRKGNYLAHTLVFALEDLDAIDADIPALIAWADRGRFFTEAPAALKHAADRKFQLEPLEVDIESLSSWRADRDKEPLAERLAGYAENRRRGVAEIALRLALSPRESRRPVLWCEAPGGGGGHVLDVLNFLFAALPFAWRRQATFSTFRAGLQPPGYEWLGTRVASPGSISDEQRCYEYQVVNEPWPAESSPRKPGQVHPWVQGLLEAMESAPQRAKICKASRFADPFAPADMAELYAPEDGFLSLAEKCKAALDRGAAEPLDPQPLLNFLDCAREDRPEALDAYHQFFDAAAPLDKHPAVIEHLNPLVVSYCKVLGGLARCNPDAVSQREGAIVQAIRAAMKAAYPNVPNAAAVLLQQLSSLPALSAAREKILPVWFRQLSAELDRQSGAGVVGQVMMFSGPALATDHRGEEGRELCSKVRRRLTAAAADMSQDVINAAEDRIQPFVDPSPADPEELAETLRLLMTIHNRRGPDLTREYLRKACAGVLNLDGVGASMHGAHRYVLFLCAYHWRNAAGVLPPVWQSLINSVSGAALWASFWDCMNPSRELCKMLVPALRDAPPLQQRAFVDRFHGSGATQLARQMAGWSPTGLTDHLCYCRAVAEVLYTVAADPRATAYSVRLLPALIVFLLHVPPEAGDEINMQEWSNAVQRAAAMLTHCHRAPEERRAFYQDLASHLAQAAQQGKFRWTESRREEVVQQFMDLWFTTQAKARDAREKPVMRKCLDQCTTGGGYIEQMFELEPASEGVASRQNPPPPTNVPPRQTTPPTNSPRQSTPPRPILPPRQNPPPRQNIPVGQNASSQQDVVHMKANFQGVFGDAPGSRSGERTASPQQRPLDSVEAMLRDQASAGNQALRHAQWTGTVRMLSELPMQLPEFLPRTAASLMRELAGVRDFPGELGHLPLADLVLLAVWCNEPVPPSLIKLLYDRTTAEGTPALLRALACIDLEGANLNAASVGENIRRRTAFTGGLAEMGPRFFAVFLANLGNRPDSADSNRLTNCPSGSDVTAYALATYLLAAADTGPGSSGGGERWRQRLRELSDSGGWQIIMNKRLLHDGQAREKFLATLKSYLRNPVLYNATYEAMFSKPI